MTNTESYFKNIFEPELVKELAEKSKPMQFHEGSVILNFGQTVRSVPLILKGVIKVMRIDESGNELLLYYVHEKETCAMTFTCCMQQHASEVKAMAEEDVELLMLPVQVMDEWLVKYPTWKSFVMSTIRNRFNELLKTIDQIAFSKLDERLASYLNEKSKVSDSSLINLSHEQIASELATSRVVVSRLLKKLEMEGKLLLYRNQIKLLGQL